MNTASIGNVVHGVLMTSPKLASMDLPIMDVEESNNQLATCSPLKRSIGALHDSPNGSSQADASDVSNDPPTAAIQRSSVSNNLLAFAQTVARDRNQRRKLF